MDEGRPERRGRYLVFAPFAHGGMASVHLGRLMGDSGFSRLVAIKQPHAKSQLEDAYDRMLLDEARLTSRIRHPNVVETIDVVREGGRLLLVMEYVHGVSLANLIVAARESDREIPVEILVAIFSDFLRGLHAAHEAKAEDGTPLGVVHRDVSPQNILVGADGVSRVLDFGVAKAIRKDHLTTTGELKGKVAYMSPEQVHGHGVTRQSDLFVTGIVLWEAITRQRLFASEDVSAVLNNVLTMTPPPLYDLVPGVPPALESLVERALMKQPRDRFSSAEEMAIALTDVCPPATAEDVARFIDYVSGDELEARTERVRAVESYRVEDEPSPPPPPKSPSPTSTRTKTKRAWIPGAAFGITFVSLIVSAWAYVRPPARDAEIEVPLADPPASSVVMDMDAPLTPEPTISVEPGEPETVVELDDPTRAAEKRSRQSARLPARPRPNCDPPYTMDEKGKKHYKPECL
jgi:serine/threonine protein kinase